MWVPAEHPRLHVYYGARYLFILLGQRCIGPTRCNVNTYLFICRDRDSTALVQPDVPPRQPLVLREFFSERKCCDVCTPKSCEQLMSTLTYLFAWTALNWSNPMLHPDMMFAPRKIVNSSMFAPDQLFRSFALRLFVVGCPRPDRQTCQQRACVRLSVHPLCLPQCLPCLSHPPAHGAVGVGLKTGCYLLSRPSVSSVRSLRHYSYNNSGNSTTTCVLLHCSSGLPSR